nr:DUF2911 domain-containing protein [uncultured Flavobacterium sp.]
MKKLIFTLFVATICSSAFAQNYSVPAVSPRQKVEHQFSISNVSVDYSRPAVNGRKVFGDLVPFGDVWRAGANSSTKITFGQNVKFGSESIAAGTYSMFIVPQAKEWRIILNKDIQSWGAYSYNETLNVLDITVPTEKLKSKIEYLEMVFMPTTDGKLNLAIAWDFTKVIIPIAEENPEVIAKMINKLKEVKQIEREANKK